MSSVIPFIGRVESAEQQDWINAINTRSKSFSLLPLDAMPAEAIQQAEVAIVANPDPATLNALPCLKWIQSLWAGVEGILGSALKPEISVVRMTDPQMAESMAEAALAWSLYLHRRMPHYAALQSAKNWKPLPLQLPQECNISVFGLGKLGSRAALRLKQNHFCVRGWSNSPKSLDGIETYHGDSGLHQILELTDIALLLLPLTESTENLFDKTRLSILPSGASLINFARGPIVVESDLITCLDNDHLDHAVLDVFNEEPLPLAHPFWSHPKVTVLPHISAPTTISTASDIAVKNIEYYYSTGKIPESVDRNKGY